MGTSMGRSVLLVCEQDGYQQGSPTQTPGDRWKAQAHPQEEEVRVRPSRCQHQAWSTSYPYRPCTSGNIKFRALRLDQGNFSWGSECCARKTRIIDVVYNASNNELVRTKTLVKNAIVVVDATPFRQWYESHYAIPLNRKKGTKMTAEEELALNKPRSKKTDKKYKLRQRVAKIETSLDEQFLTGRLLAAVSSRPGQCGRADGYILEGKELEFYLKKMKPKKGK